MFLVLKGEVGVFSDGTQQSRKELAMLGAGELFADAALLLNQKAAYTTVTLCDSIILPVSSGSALDLIKEEPALALEMIRDLCLRLDAAVHSQMAAQKNGLCGNLFAGSAVPAVPPSTLPAQDIRPFSLFPEDHGCYQLKLADPASSYLLEKPYVCPICRDHFTMPAVRPSKLVVATAEPDLRYRYKEIEPLYYEVVTCPRCLYSALPDVFHAPDKPKPDIQLELAKLKQQVHISFDKNKTVDMVFAGFYLGLFCAPISFTSDKLILGRLLYKLSRVYSDAADTHMERRTANSALEHFLSAYTRIRMSPSQEQQVCTTIGELYLKKNDFRNALTFFSKARANGTSLVLKNHADDRIHDIRAKAQERRT
jgi:uncharacterized protein (DUF2225 family)